MQGKISILFLKSRLKQFKKYSIYTYKVSENILMKAKICLSDKIYLVEISSFYAGICISKTMVKIA